MKNRMGIFQASMKLLLVFVAGILAILVSTGLGFRLEKLIDPDFWLGVGIKLICIMLIYNAVYGLVCDFLRQLDNTKYYVTLATNRMRVDEIYVKKMFDALDLAIKDENKEKNVAACNAVLRKVTTRLSYDDIDLERFDIDGLKRKYLLNRWQAWRLKRAILKIANGKVKSDVMNADHILKDKDGEKDKTISASYDMRRWAAIKQLMKVIQIIVSTVVFTAVLFGQGDMSFLEAAITNGLLLLNAVVSGISFAYSFIKTRTAVFEQKNRFLQRRMGITVECTSPKKSA
jgi:hypothetical protein